MKYLTGFHAITSRLRQKPETVREIYVDADRKDGRAKDLRELAKRLRRARDFGRDAAAGRHGGRACATRAWWRPPSRSTCPSSSRTCWRASRSRRCSCCSTACRIPHNLGACLRVADGAGAHAVIAPKDRSVGLTTAAIKVASGAAESVPYIVVTNLARTMRDLKDRGIWLVGADDSAGESVYNAKLEGADRDGARAPRARGCAGSRATAATCWCRSRCSARSKA